MFTGLVESVGVVRSLRRASMAPVSPSLLSAAAAFRPTFRRRPWIVRIWLPSKQDNRSILSGPCGSVIVSAVTLSAVISMPLRLWRIAVMMVMRSA